MWELWVLLQITFSMALVLIAFFGYYFLCAWLGIDTSWPDEGA
jgi:hypothetical protein